MKLECQRKRPGGTKVQLGSTEYHFKPTGTDPKGPHICDVTNEAHIKILLKIDAYTIYGSDSDPTPAPAPDPTPAPAPDPTPAPTPEPTAQAPQAAGTDIPTEPTKPTEPTEGGENPLDGITAEMLEEMERDELADLYEKITGKKPHHNTGAQKLIEGITPKLKA